MVRITDKIDEYSSMKVISDDGFQAIVHSNYYDGMGENKNAIFIYKNDDGDGLYGKPAQVIHGLAYDKLKDFLLNK